MIPPDGTIVTALIPTWGAHEPIERTELTGPLQSRWIPGPAYMKYEIHGVGIDPDTIKVVEPIQEVTVTRNEVSGDQKAKRRAYAAAYRARKKGQAVSSPASDRGGRVQE